jgi:hypothetical protein
MLTWTAAISQLCGFARQTDETKAQTWANAICNIYRLSAVDYFENSLRFIVHFASPRLWRLA